MLIWRGISRPLNLPSEQTTTQYTGRIGNKGLATSFYNERNEDLGMELTHFLQESNQPVPDFLEEFKVADGEPMCLST